MPRKLTAAEFKRLTARGGVKVRYPEPKVEAKPEPKVEAKPEPKVEAPRAEFDSTALVTAFRQAIEASQTERVVREVVTQKMELEPPKKMEVSIRRAANGRIQAMSVRSDEAAWGVFVGSRDEDGLIRDVKIVPETH